MTRMAEPERPRDEHDYDDERFEDEGRRSIFSALWFLLERSRWQGYR